MAYYVDAGGPSLVEFDTIADARRYAEIQLDSAREVALKLGFMPYWGRSLEIRKGPKSDKIGAGWRYDTTDYNNAILAKTKTFVVMQAKES
jgi:hypothetical protein